MQKKRLFVAVNLTNEIKDALSGLATRVGKHLDGRVSWVHRDNYHITLKFLGPVDINAVAELDEALKTAARGVPPFGFDVEGLGCFPNPNRAKVLWAGLRGFSDSLPQLAERIETACARVGFKKDGRPFSPHITIGRVKGQLKPRQVVSAIEQAENNFLGELWVESFELMESNLKPRRAEYIPLSTYSLV